MKIEELHIGDWYKLGRKYYQVTREIYALSDKEIAKFNPIDITPEILVKSGFKSNNKLSLNHDYYEVNGIMVTRGYWTNNKEYWYVDIEVEYECTEMMCQIKYIHELQHILDALQTEIHINL